jgi:hypothetical protein
LEDFAEVLAWRDGNSAYTRCPGEALHTTPTNPRDCLVYLTGAPSAHCQHQSCQAEVDALSSALRTAFPSDREIPRDTSRANIDYAAVRNAKKTALVKSGRAAQERILSQYPWPRCDIWESSPYRFSDELEHRTCRQFLALAFDAEDLLFIGHPERSNEWGAIRSCSDWLGSADLLSRPAICPSTFKHSIGGRRKENVACVRYVVLEADGLSADHEENQDLSGALIRYACERLGLNLFAVVDSGNKSLHAFFVADERLRSFLSMPDAAAHLSAIGFDPAAVRPAQTFRLPGHTRQDTSRIQSLLYFDPTASAVRTTTTTTTERN